MLRHNSELDSAFLNVKNRICDFTLRKHVLVRVEFKDRFPFSHLGEKYFRIKRVLNCVAHVNLHYFCKGYSRLTQNLVCSSMRSPDGDLLRPVTGCRSSAAVIALVRGSRQSVSCSPQTRLCASGIASRVDERNRRPRNCFYFRAPAPSRSETGKHSLWNLATPNIFVQQ